MVFRRGISPVVGRVRMAWKRRDVRAHTKATAALGRLGAPNVPAAQDATLNWAWSQTPLAIEPGPDEPER